MNSNFIKPGSDESEGLSLESLFYFRNHEEYKMISIEEVRLLCD